MERTILKEMSKSALTAYVNRQKELLLQKLYWNQFFTLRRSVSLTWESLSGSSGAPVMADVIEYNATAPIKTRRVVKKASGDIPKTALKRKMDEKDMNDYLYLQQMASSDADKKEILRIVFDDTRFVYTGVQARTEFLALQALSTGALTLDSTNNNGIITEVAVDWGIPSANKTAVTTIWSTAGSATPVQDIRAKYKDIKAAGHVCSFIVMDEATYMYMVATTELKDAYAFYQGVSTGRVAVPSLEGVNAMLAAERLPQIMIVDSSVRHESAAHAISAISPWNAGHVAFIPTMKVGDIKHGTIAEENDPNLRKIATMTKTDHVLITKWSDLEPYGEYTKGQGNFFPAFSDVEQIYLLETLDTSW